jgi:hypothetical protein
LNAEKKVAASLTRPHRALQLLRELVRLAARNDLTLLHTPESIRVWKQAKALAAEEQDAP